VIINRNPNGLLGFLGIKNGGRNPGVLTAELSADFELSELYYCNNPIMDAYTQLGVAAAGSYVAFTPPDNNVWKVLEYSAFVSTPAAVTCDVALAKLGQANTRWVGLSDSVALVASQSKVITSEYPGIIAQGERLGFYVATVTGAGLNIEVQVRYALLEA
jgi:hypothetical protein